MKDRKALFINNNHNYFLISRSYIFLIFFFCSVSIFMPETVNAQLPGGIASGQNLSNVKVDQMSDDQIKQLLQKSQASGMSQQQLESAVLAKGMQPSEILKLRARMASLKLQTGQKQEQFSSEDRSRKEEEIDNGTQPNQQATGPNKIFGYSLFNNPNIKFEPNMNMPTPKNYQLGPGDELIVDVWGASQATYHLKISPDGNVLINNVGPVHVNGLTVENASYKIIGRLHKNYAGLFHNTWAQVTLGNVRSIKVTIVGEVRTPGAYTLSSLSSVFNALYLSGGPSVNGSFRNIQVIRGGRVAATLDVYDFLLHGKPINDIHLKDQDIIYVGNYKTRVEISGKVKHPAIFEVKGDENLDNVLAFAGGYSDKAYSKRIKIYRNTDRERKVLDIESDEFKHFSLHNGDSIVVDPILERFENRVEINGAVYRPGIYALTDNITLKELIAKAEGLKTDAFLSRASIYRHKDDYSIEVIPVDLSAVMKGVSPDITLQREDLVKIPSIYDLKETYSLEIEGEIKKPGNYPFLENSTLHDLIVMAGGFLESASISHIEIARRLKDVKDSITDQTAEIYTFGVSENLCLSDSANKFILKPFDRVFVRTSPGYMVQKMVRIEGEVKYPGSYSIKSKSETVSDLVNRGGGLTPEAYLPGAHLVRQIYADPQEKKRMIEQLKQQVSDSTKIEVPVETEQTVGIDLKKILHKPHTFDDLIIQEGDVLVIPKELQTVQVNGAVLHPAAVHYKNRGFRHYISNAGGFTENARGSKSYVIYANGSVNRTKNFIFFRKYPRIEPGAEIVVPKKAERVKMSPQEAVGLASALSSAALVIVTVVNLIKW